MSCPLSCTALKILHPMRMNSPLSCIALKIIVYWLCTMFCSSLNVTLLLVNDVVVPFCSTIKIFTQRRWVVLCLALPWRFFIQCGWIVLCLAVACCVIHCWWVGCSLKVRLRRTLLLAELGASVLEPHLNRYTQLTDGIYCRTKKVENIYLFAAVAYLEDNRMPWPERPDKNLHNFASWSITFYVLVNKKTLQL